MSARDLLVAGLCADWCGTCRDWQPLFEAQSQVFAGRAHFEWIDVEDHDEVMGAIDVENFPTLLIADGAEVLFFGTILPHEQTLSRLVQSALDGDMQPRRDDELDGLARRVRAAL